jgi:hypothetical protein
MTDAFFSCFSSEGGKESNFTYADLIALNGVFGLPAIISKLGILICWTEDSLLEY